MLVFRYGRNTRRTGACLRRAMEAEYIYTCPHCAEQCSIPQALTGQNLICPRCSQQFFATPPATPEPPVQAGPEEVPNPPPTVATTQSGEDTETRQLSTPSSTLESPDIETIPIPPETQRSITPPIIPENVRPFYDDAIKGDPLAQCLRDSPLSRPMFGCF